MLPAFRIAAIAEATSFLVLIGAMVAKYGYGEETGVEVVGPVHGLLFLGYVVLAWLLAQERGWGWTRRLVLLAAGVVPLAGFWVERRIARDGDPLPRGRERTA
jgi:integral membrane protein